MKLLLVLALSFISTHCQQNPEPTQGACARNGDLRLSHKIGDSFGALQVCRSKWGWRYITPMYWTQAAARLACRQLNLGYMNAASGSLRLSSNVPIWRIRDADCIEDACKLNDCTEYIGQQQTVVTVNCVDCTDGAVRLVGGSTVSEGRLEICHNGQWGTICNQGWTDSRAGQVCGRLGLPTYNATLHQFNGGAGSVYTLNCPTMDSDISNCIQESSCAHSMDVGVRCLPPFTDACADPVNKAITTVETPTACNCQQPKTSTPSTPPTPTPTIGRCTPANTPGVGNEMSTSKQPAISTETLRLNNGTTTESSISQSTVMSTSGTLGALIGLLAAALVTLVVVVTGWIVSCVYLQQKINKKCKDHTHTTSVSTSDPTLQLHNPVYDGSTTVPHTMYSSHGPSYEVIDTNEGEGHSYDVISHRGATRPHPHTTHPVSNEEYSTLDTSRENEYHTLEINTGDGQYSMVGQSDPHNDRPDPQDYEVPAPLRGKSTLH